ncbi:hypothetical protein LJC60_06635 [Ruminococcaceae bacterium OttesenSCG-928-D13]|nr:hypothetical protein [Ruminococcaceae bacterium OttesenSCG-928-D13]
MSSLDTQATITVEGTTALTIQNAAGAEGSLTAANTGLYGGIGAAIGARYNQDAGTIVINSGTVTTISDGRGAGIGGSFGGRSGTITINGGTVSATSEYGHAAIGGRDGGTVTINGGSVTANAENGVAIGGRDNDIGTTVTINGGTVNATSTGNAGISGGGDKGVIVINGGDVTATGADIGAGIGGGGELMGGGTITITGGTVVATGGEDTAGIGGGRAGNGAKLTITGGMVTASGGAHSVGGGAEGVDDDEAGEAGTTEISGGILIADTIQGGVTKNGEQRYKVKVSGAALPGNTTLTYSVAGGAQQTFKTAPNGALELYLAEGDSGAEIKLECGGKTYKGILTVNTAGTGSVTLQEEDKTAPTLSAGSGTRTGEDTGTVTFTSNEAGTYYYTVLEAGAQAPATIDTSGPGTACKANEQTTIKLSGLGDVAAKDVWVVVKDAAGNVSTSVKVALAKCEVREVTVEIPGVTLPSTKDITVTIDGKDQTVKTDGDGKLVVELPDGEHTIGLSHEGKDYTGTITVGDGNVKVELKEVVPEPPRKPGKGLVLQIGDTADDFNKLTVYIEGASAASLGLAGLSLETQEAASAALTRIRGAIELVSINRGQLGAYQNRLEHTIANLSNTVENMTAAESRIRDADMSSEMMDFTKYNVLAQAAQAMLAQANMQPQQVMQLLR